MGAAEDTSGRDAKRAVNRGFELFEELMGSNGLGHVLLEGLEWDRDEDEEEAVWKISIGFDAGRKRDRAHGMGGLFDQAKEPIRELRTIVIRADDGGSLRMHGS